MEYLCTVSVLRLITNDFLHEVYSFAPFIHVPMITNKLHECSYINKPTLIRLILALCVMTVASLLREFSVYYLESNNDVDAAVTRAMHPVRAIYLSNHPDWISYPTLSDVTVCLLLGTASYHNQCPTRGWALINESVSCCRTIGTLREGWIPGPKRYRSRDLQEGKIMHERRH